MEKLTYKEKEILLGKALDMMNNNQFEVFGNSEKLTLWDYSFSSCNMAIFTKEVSSNFEIKSIEGAAIFLNNLDKKSEYQDLTITIQK